MCFVELPCGRKDFFLILVFQEARKPKNNAVSFKKNFRKKIHLPLKNYSFFPLEAVYFPLEKTTFTFEKMVFSFSKKAFS